VADLENTGYQNVTNLVQDGVGTDFATEAYYGASWTAFHPGRNEIVNCEIAIVGATNTTFIAECISANTAPTAAAGADQSVASAAAVTLDGTGSSDPDAGQTLTYAWTAPAGITLSDATAPSPTFTASTLAVGGANKVLTFSLIVTDNLGLSSTANTVTIAVTAPANMAPTAAAGADQSVASATTVTLDGTGSSDSDAGQTLTYAWTAPAGITLSDATAPSPTFTASTLAAGGADEVLAFSLIVTDNLGLQSVAADTVTITVAAPLDITPPTVTLSGAPETLSNTDPFTVTATFDEEVTDFNDLANDITTSNASVTAIAGGPSVYTLTVTPTGAGEVSITVPAAAAQDGASNDNTASNTLVIGNRIVEITDEAIAGFMLGRANNLASNQPGLTRFLQGDGCGAFSVNATEGSGSINGCVSQGNTWAENSGAWSGDDSYTLATFGAHGFVNQNLLVGGILQFDSAEISANNASGNGNMVGPYFVAQVPDQPLFFEGRLLYGQTDNDISPLGTYTDSFETERWLAQVRATGEYQVEATTLMPLLDFTYTDDTPKAYTDSLGNTIKGQKVSLMQLSAGVNFSTPIPVSTGALELTGGLSGLYSSTDGGAAAPEFENWRGRTHLGLNYAMTNGANLSGTTFYDGIGTDYESYGASLGFDFKF
jgi:hypothetical protein